MSIALSIRVEDYATPAVEEKLARSQPAAWLHHIGASLAQFWHDHIKALGPNVKFPGQSTSFWERAADSVHYDFPAPDQLELIADQQGIAQRYYGGPIVPRPENKLGLLIFPIAAESYGKTYAEVKAEVGARSHREWVKEERKGSAQHIRAVNRERKKILEEKGGVLEAGDIIYLSDLEAKTGYGRKRISFAKPGQSPMKGLFAFAKSVTQSGNPDVVPDEDEFMEVALARLETAL